jgi:hypothetical protein
VFHRQWLFGENLLNIRLVVIKLYISEFKLAYTEWFPGIHIQVKCKLFIQFFRGLYDTTVDCLRKPNEADSIDPRGTVDSRIELSSCVVVIRRWSPPFVLSIFKRE